MEPNPELPTSPIARLLRKRRDPTCRERRSRDSYATFLLTNPTGCLKARRVYSHPGGCSGTSNRLTDRVEREGGAPPQATPPYIKRGNPPLCPCAPIPLNLFSIILTYSADPLSYIKPVNHFTVNIHLLLLVLVCFREAFQDEEPKEGGLPFSKVATRINACMKLNLRRAN